MINWFIDKMTNRWISNESYENNNNKGCSLSMNSIETFSKDDHVFFLLFKF